MAFNQQGNPFAQMLQQNPINQQGNPLAQLLQMFSGGLGGQPSANPWASLAGGNTDWSLVNSQRDQRGVPLPVNQAIAQSTPLQIMPNPWDMLAQGARGLPNRTTPVVPNQAQQGVMYNGQMMTPQDYITQRRGGTLTPEQAKAGYQGAPGTFDNYAYQQATSPEVSRPKPGTLADWKLRNGY